MYINAIADALTHLAIGGRAILEPTNGDDATIVFELLEPFMQAYHCEYSHCKHVDGTILVECTHRDVFGHIATYLEELLQHDYCEADTRQAALISLLLRDVKCSFDSEQIHSDHWSIRIYM